MKPYLVELQKHHSDLLAEVRIPTGRIAVFVHGELSCYTELNETGFLDLMLPDGIFEQLESGEAVFQFPTREIPSDQLKPDGRTKRIGSVHIVRAVK